jgi:predicted metalloprotease
VSEPQRSAGTTRGGALLVGAGVFAIGGLGYWAFQAAGFEGFSAGIAAQALLVAIVLVWTGSYLFRVVTGNMTYMEQRRRYRSAYDAATEQDLQERFEALSPAEQEALLREIGQLPADGVPTGEQS